MSTNTATLGLLFLCLLMAAFSAHENRKAATANLAAQQAFGAAMQALRDSSGRDEP